MPAARITTVRPLPYLAGFLFALLIAASSPAWAFHGPSGCYNWPGATQGNDFVSGFDNNCDHLDMLGGNDEAHGNGHNDGIHGRYGADRLYGNHGNDTIDGGPDADLINGGAGTDNCITGAGDNVLNCP